MDAIDGAQIGQRVAALLKEQKRSQYWLAKQINTSVTYIQKLCRGEIARPSWENLRAIAAVLGFETVDAMLEGVAPREDVATPPEDLLRAAGYSEPLIARLVESWSRQPAKFRSDVIARAKRRIQESQDLIGAIL